MLRPFFILALIFAGAVVNAEPTGGVKYMGEDYTDNYAYGGLAGAEDVLMPTLEEMLGGPVDDFGDFADIEQLQSDLVEYAKKYIGCRYVHGGKGPKVFDCSGYTSYIYRNFGYNISPGSRMQGTQGTRVDISDVQVGDLMFFSGRAGGRTVGHVGMVVDVDEATGKLKFIHASCKKGVTVQSFPDGAYYSKHFLHVQRVIDPEKLQASN